MGRTLRRHSYRRSKRWNPSRYQSEAQATAETVRYVRKGRNPAFTRYLGDGSRVDVSADGQVTVSDGGGVFSRYRIGHSRLHAFLRDLKTPARRSNKYDYQGEALQEEGSYVVQLNPKRGRGHRGKRRKGRARRPLKSWRPKRSRHGSKRGKRSRARKYSNPYISPREAKAMARVLRRHGRRCSGKRRGRGRRR